MASSPPFAFFPPARPAVNDEPTDAELVAQCRAGRQAAWSTLVRRYQRLVYTVPRRAGLSDDEAADVFQACFSRLFEHLDRIDDAARVRAWLVTTAKRETLRLLEARRRFVDLVPAGASDAEGDDAGDPMERIADPGPLPEQLLGELQEHDRLRRALDRIDARSRQFLELLFLQDEPLPYSEIAARLGIAEGSIGPTRARCLAKLRTALDALRDA
jgi:RNA polymerase sigma factor (sigma-70 family)